MEIVSLKLQVQISRIYKHIPSESKSANPLTEGTEITSFVVLFLFWGWFFVLFGFLVFIFFCFPFFFIFKSRPMEEVGRLLSHHIKKKIIKCSKKVEAQNLDSYL